MKDYFKGDTDPQKELLAIIRQSSDDNALGYDYLPLLVLFW